MELFESLLELLLPLIVVVFSFAARASKNKKAVAAHRASSADFDARLRGTNAEPQKNETRMEQTLRPAAPAAAKVAVTAPVTLQEEHFHEGRPEAPCPATEARPSERRETTAIPEIPGLKLSFDRNTVLQGFVMSEILNRPRPGARR